MLVEEILQLALKNTKLCQIKRKFLTKVSPAKISFFSEKDILKLLGEHEIIKLRNWSKCKITLWQWEILIKINITILMADLEIIKISLILKIMKNKRWESLAHQLKK